MRKSWLFFILVIVLTLIFFNGIVRLLVMRLQSGDVYPPYSTLRTDPLGAKALYESLQTCCGLDVSRNYQPFFKIKNQVDATVIFTGAEPPATDRLPRQFLEDFEAFIKNGGRMVVTYAPPPKPSFGTILEDEQEEEKDQEEKKEDDQKKKKERENPDLVSFYDRWGIGYKKYPLEGATRAKLVESPVENNFPEEISWHSPVYFDLKGSEWSVIYQRENHPVIVERSWGKGSVALVSDSYLLSNEAMLRERHPALLAWMAGNKNRVIFDEYLHGIAENPGIAALARKYRLYGLVGGLLLLAVLFIWKNAASLVPKYSPEGAIQAAGLSQGKDSTSGLMNLLRRSIPADQIFNVCYGEWKKVIKGQDVRLRGKMERIETAAGSPDRLKHGAEIYNAISRILKER